MKKDNFDNLLDLANLLAHQNDFDEITRIISQKAALLLNADLALILMLNPKTHNTVKTVQKEGDTIVHPRYSAVQNLLSGWIIKNESPLFSENFKGDPRFQKIKLGDIDISSVIGAPLWSEGVIIGTLLLFTLKQATFSQDDIELLQNLALIAAPYVRNVQHIQEYFDVPLPNETLLAKYKAMGLLGKSPRFIALLRTIEAATRCDVRVVLEGESGTGKELVARAIHNLGERASKPFVGIDCGAIPEHLFESELFGHVRGAFTGANVNRKGLIEEADGGTLFMDEIANLPLEMQAKLLRVIQEKEIRSVGSNRMKAIDIRIIAASSVSLQKLVKDGSFREDLFYRLYIYPITIPALTERPEDIPLLANFFLHKFALEQNKEVESIHEIILNFIKHHKWKGNIRELENFIERLVTVLAPGQKTVHPSFLPDEIRKMIKIKDEPYATASLDELLSAYEKRLIQQALKASNGNQSKAARMLKISQQSIQYKINKLGI